MKMDLIIMEVGFKLLQNDKGYSYYDNNCSYCDFFNYEGVFLDVVYNFVIIILQIQ